MKSTALATLMIIVILLSYCRKSPYSKVGNLPTPYIFQVPLGFPSPNLPMDNPLTYEGIELGRHIFYDKRLSIDNSIACSSCHTPELSFSDDKAFSLGVNDSMGMRNSLPLFNLAWYDGYMWDSAGKNLENQVLIPLMSHLEMALDPEDLDMVIRRFEQDEQFMKLYNRAFPNQIIGPENLFKALVQFELSLVSANSKYDQVQKGIASFSESEMKGMNIFQSTNDSAGDGGCIHCHSLGGNFSDKTFRNNGLQYSSGHMDKGLQRITRSSSDQFKFKVPSLRNLKYTAPYMHDGRFSTLDEVVDHYNNHIDQSSPNLDNHLKGLKVKIGRLSSQDKQDLINFLETLNDIEFVNNPAYKNPN